MKDYLDVGTTWNYDFDVVTSYEPLQTGGTSLPDLTSNYEIDLEIVEKDASLVVNGTTYSPVIKVKFLQRVSVVGFPNSNSRADYFYYFAKDVGIVKVEGTLYDGDDNITSNVLQELKSYVIN